MGHVEESTSPKGRARPLHILMVTTSFPLRDGSFEGCFVERLARRVAERISVTVLTPHAPGLPKREQRGDVRIFRFRYAPELFETLAYEPGGIPQKLRSNKLHYFALPLFLLSLAFHISLLARRCDVIHANWAITGFVACAARALHRRPVVVTLRGSDVRLCETGRLLRWVFGYALRHATRVTAVNEAFVRRERESNIRFIPNGVDFAEITPSGDPKARPYRFITIGSLIPGKCVDLAIDAMSVLIRRGRAVELVIVGDGAEGRGLQSRARDKGVDGCIRFTGLLEHKDAMRELRAADCLVLASEWEGRPNVLLEAMAAGKPVVTSDLPGCLEIVEEGRNGHTFKRGDSSDLAEKMDRFVADPILGRQMGEEGKRFVLRNDLTWDRCADSYIAVFEEALESACAASSAS